MAVKPQRAVEGDCFWHGAEGHGWGCHPIMIKLKTPWLLYNNCIIL